MTDAGIRSGQAAAVDRRLPLRRLAPLSAQHVLAMVASPVSTVFLTGQALGLDAGRTASLLSATLVLCGAGTLLQSVGVWRIGARLPFVMLPGGAATALFIQTAREHGPATATGSVLLAAALLCAVLPFYARIVRLFPPLVMGTTVLLIGIGMIKIGAQLITGRSGTAGYAARPAVVLAAATIGCTLLLLLLLRGVWRQTAVLLGMGAGTLVAVTTGLGGFAPPQAAGADRGAGRFRGPGLFRTSFPTEPRTSTCSPRCRCCSSASPRSRRSPGRPSSTARRWAAFPTQGAMCPASRGPTRWSRYSAGCSALHCS